MGAKSEVESLLVDKVYGGVTSGVVTKAIVITADQADKSYVKPGTGIPESDLAQAVKNKLAGGAGAVRHDVDQSLQLSDTEKKTARNNIDAEGGAWKLIADTTISAQSAPVFTTFNDGTPLKAKEVVLYAFWETAHSSNDNGYFVVNTATYSNVRFGAFSMGNTYANRISKVYISTKSPIIEGYIASSEAYAIASVANNQICMGYSSSATPPYVGGEDITKVQIAPNAFTGTTRFMIYGR